MYIFRQYTEYSILTLVCIAIVENLYSIQP